MRFSNEFGYCDLNEFPGCSQLIVSNHAFIYKEHRDQGHGDANHKARLKRCKELGYDAVICTVRADNFIERHILQKNEWNKIGEFFSKQTSHIIEIWMKNL